jgi:hypothetical protein
MRTTWAAAIALACLVCSALSITPARPLPELAGAQVVFIGSSLIVAAIPLADSTEGILGDRRRHARLAINGISEVQSTEILRTASHSPVREIFVDVYPYIRTFHVRGEAPAAVDHEVSWATGLIDSLQPAWERAGETLRYKIGMLAGVPVGLWSLENNEPGGMDTVYDGKHSHFGDFYPMNIHQPTAPRTLEKVLAVARENGVRVTFIALPRSQEAEAFIGQAAQRELSAALAAFQRHFGVEVWSPAASWPNDHFRDQGHFNGLGRARFLEALRARFAASR